MLFYLIEKLFHCTVRNNLASLSKKIWKINTIFTLRTAIVALILHGSLYIIKFVINKKKKLKRTLKLFSTSLYFHQGSSF